MRPIRTSVSVHQEKYWWSLRVSTRPGLLLPLPEPSHALGPAYARPRLCRAAVPAGIVLGDLEPEGFKHCDQTAQATLVVEPGSVVRELFVTHEARHGLVVHSAGPLVRGTVQDGRVAMTTRIRSATSRQALDHGAGSKKPTSAMAAARCRDPARAKGPLLAVTGAFPHRRGHSTWNSRSRLRAARCQPHMKREAASFAPFACGREACGSWHLLRTASAHDELRVADRGVSP